MLEQAPCGIYPPGFFWSSIVSDCTGIYSFGIKVLVGEGESAGGADWPLRGICVAAGGFSARCSSMGKSTARL